VNRKLLSVLVLLVSCSNVFYAQFINRDEIKGNEGYTNYSGRNYENYSIQFNKRKIYDNFGNFLVDGLSIYELNESQSEFINPVLGGSDVQKSKYYNLWFNNLVIGNDTYGGFNSRIMLGEAIRTKFTSLTFDKARFNGMRWDGATDKYRGSIIASRESDPVRIRFDASSLPNSIARPRDWSTYLFGGHVETDLGDILTVGATYVNQDQRHSSVDSKNASLKGVVANAIPRVIFVRVRDDSPLDNSGPIVYAQPKIIVNGTERPIVNINGGIPSQVNTNLNNPIQYWVFKDFSINSQLYVPGKGVNTGVVDAVTGNIIYKNYTHYTDYRSQFTMNQGAVIPPPQYPVELQGASSLTYAFVMPYGTQSVKISLLLANDYAVDAAHDWVLVADKYPDSPDDPRYPNHWDTTQAGTPTPFFTVERAMGNVQDASNKRWVTYTYGLTSGMAVYGMNFKFDWNGFKIDGEVDQSATYSKYPLLSAPFQQKDGTAFYFRGTKKIGRLTLGGERYRIEPWYSTSLNVYTLENSYYSSFDNTGAIVYNPPDAIGYTSDDASKVTTDNLLAGGAYYDLVDDNDDNDRWEDGFNFYNATANTLFPRNTDVLNRKPDPFLLGYRQNINELTGLNDIIRKPDAGIFPGKDKDHDGIPDDDRNSNGLPDYTEDFLTYYSDPPAFEAGDDWNNNSVIDDQENDIYPDYPYNPDTDGWHGFLMLEAMRNMQFTVGIIRETALARGGESDVNYFKTTYNASTPRFGSVDVYYTLKRVHDNVRNDGYQFSGVISNDPTPQYVIDPLLYRNSLSHTLYVGTRYTQIPNLNIENNVRYESNKRYIVGSPTLAKLQYGPLVDEQFPGEISSLGLVNKIDYTYSMLENRLQFRPQFKIRTLKVVSTNVYDDHSTSTVIMTHTQSLIPILRVDYRLTNNTELHFGVQGTALFGLTDAFLVKNRFLRDGVGDVNASTTAISMTNKAQYSGYNIVIDFGYKITNYDYQRPVEKINNTQFSLIYFTIFAGY
jgi:hypothetical protein